MATSSIAATAAVANVGSGILAAAAGDQCPQTMILREILCAAVAAVFTITWLHPVDVVKTRIQISGTNQSDEERLSGDKNSDDPSYASLIRSVATREGWASFYRGITAAWIAEAVYYGLQLGLYEPLKKYFRVDNSGDVGSSSFATKLLAGAFAGSFGAVTGNPFVILRTRMIANKGLRRSVVSFARDVLRDEGPLGFYKGFTAMFLRAIVLSATKMATYDTCKSFVENRLSLARGDLSVRFASAFVAGFFITVTVMPFDVIRTRMMLPDSGERARSFVQCAGDVYRRYGLGGYYRGASAFWVRIAPKTCLQFIAFEHLKQHGPYFRFGNDGNNRKID